MLKRVMDIFMSTLLILLLSPLMLVTACLVYIGIGTPILFTQPRPGLGGKIFQLYKFRTMQIAFTPDGNPLPDAARITPIGRWLRSLSIDELPQLFNVFKGEMSLVGPRPLLVEYLPLYSPEQNRRHQVKPGITGWAQVNGRNAITWEQKFELDTWYVDHQSLRLDIKILFLTFFKVIHRKGINSNSETTAIAFKGSTQDSSCGLPVGACRQDSKIGR